MARCNFRVVVYHVDHIKHGTSTLNGHMATGKNLKKASAFKLDLKQT